MEHLCSLVVRDNVLQLLYDEETSLIYLIYDDIDRRGNTSIYKLSNDCEIVHYMNDKHEDTNVYPFKETNLDYDSLGFFEFVKQVILNKVYDKI